MQKVQSLMINNFVFPSLYISSYILVYITKYKQSFLHGLLSIRLLQIEEMVDKDRMKAEYNSFVYNSTYM